MASLHHHAAVLLTFGLLAGCGGDRTRGGSHADTTGAAAVTPDSAAMPMKDTGSAAAPDTAASSAAPADTAKRPSAVAQAPKPAPSKAAAGDTSAKRAPTSKSKQMAAAGARTAHDTGAAPSAQASRDTGRVQAAESTKSAATPRPAPTAQQQTPAPQSSAQPRAPAPAQPQDTSKPAAAQQDATQQEAPLRDAYHQAPRDTVDQATYDGWKQFNLNCARCHGEDALGTTIAPHLILSLKPDGPINTKELFVQTVCAGRPTKGMPSWCALGLDMGKINDIYLYVKGRSDAKIAPGRPAVKSGG